ncbi:MAG: branched chain amino acid aminotransferase [Bacteroidetes bacterium B1(2017)]|nr:MAG: branched chain amino acid aminotransferase [Bacteroidetes bacterium B1(2017)]
MAISIKISKTPQSRIHLCDFENIEFGKIFSDHMFRVDYVDGKWMEPSIEPYGPISISPSLSALHYGQAIFEGMKAFKSPNGKPLLFRPMDNVRRLNKSAVRMGMPEIPEELFYEGLKKLVEVDQDWIPTKDGSALYLRPFMFATDDFVGVRPSLNYSFIIFCCPVNSYYPKPIKVKVEKKYVRASTGMAGYAKAAGNYGISMLPTMEAKKDGYDQIIWTDGKTHEHVEESGTTNLFFVLNDKLVLTPILDGNILEGITRDSVIKLLKKEGYEVQERDISVSEIIAAAKAGELTDAFGTGTAAIIAKIAAIGFEGHDYVLPEAEQRKVSNWVYNTVYQIQTGKIEDPFNWVEEVK